MNDETKGKHGVINQSVDNKMLDRPDGIGVGSFPFEFIHNPCHIIGTPRRNKEFSSIVIYGNGLSRIKMMREFILMPVLDDNSRKGAIFISIINNKTQSLAALAVYGVEEFFFLPTQKQIPHHDSQ